jgi:hypothetical protein
MRMTCRSIEEAAEAMSITPTQASFARWPAARGVEAPDSVSVPSALAAKGIAPGGICAGLQQRCPGLQAPVVHALGRLSARREYQ